MVSTIVANRVYLWKFIKFRFWVVETFELFSCLLSLFILSLSNFFKVMMSKRVKTKCEVWKRLTFLIKQFTTTYQPSTQGVVVDSFVVCCAFTDLHHGGTCCR